MLKEATLSFESQLAGHRSLISLIRLLLNANADRIEGGGRLRGHAPLHRLRCRSPQRLLFNTCKEVEKTKDPVHTLKALEPL